MSDEVVRMPNIWRGMSANAQSIRIEVNRGESWRIASTSRCWLKKLPSTCAAYGSRAMGFSKLRGCAIR
jgi:hypothetical protein